MGVFNQTNRRTEAILDGVGFGQKVRSVILGESGVTKFQPQPGDSGIFPCPLEKTRDFDHAMASEQAQLESQTPSDARFRRNGFLISFEGIVS